MLSLLSLFAPRRAMRSFVLIDAQGICRALRQSAQTPEAAGWVEVQESCLSWLNQPLPAGACGAKVTATATPPRMLAA